MMKQLNLGNSGLNASAVALGCMRIGELPAEKLERLFFAALEAGINFFDHADIYGGGLCETRFGELLARHPGLREKILLQSKCGIRKGFFDFSKKHILESVEGSLKRLQTDRLDLLLLHRPDTLMEPEEVAEAFQLLYDSGKVRHFGVSNENPAQMELLQKFLPRKLIVNQLQFGPAHTSLVDCGLNVNINSSAGTMFDGSVLEYCRLREVTIQTWSPFLFGFFEGNFLVDSRFAELNTTLGRIGERYGISREATAIEWIARHPARIQTIIGTTRADRVADYSRGADVELTREEWYEIYRSAGNRLP